MITTCPICGGEMERGRRALVEIRWEYVRKRPERFKPPWGEVGRSKHVCRDCAMKVNDLAGLEAPEKVF